MKAKRRSVKAGRKAPVRRKPLPPITTDVPVDLMLRCVAWVLRFMRLREDRSVYELAQLGGISYETARSYDLGDHTDAWVVSCKLARALGRQPAYVGELARRYLRIYLLHEERLHRGEKNWKLILPWQRKDRGKRTD